MTTFRDTNGREWVIRLDGPTVREIRQALGVDLVDNGQGLAKLEQDIVLLVDTLWLLCRDQAAEGYTERDFGRALNGDVLGKAAEALTGAALDFFPPARRSLVASLVEKQRSVMRHAEQAVMEKLSATATDEQIREALERTLEDELKAALQKYTPSSATSSPASVASAPTD